MNKVTTLRKSLASCPECGCQFWEIEVDKFGLAWENIVSFSCSACDFYVVIKIIKEKKPCKG